MMFSKILIANRGEIACRVAATCRRLGIKTVAVYSDADAKSQHVKACDEAFHIGAAPAKDSYLQVDKIIAVALATGAQAIHPGYGFLSENESFAKACADNQLVFIGPPASSIAAMGSKSAAKSLMEKAGVPLVPGYHGDNQDADFLKQQADSIGYPVLLKASAGGGGKGMRIVEAASAFEEALISCKREAISSFGDDKVLVEKYLTRPRHIEIQVFADTFGDCVYLFERDCSAQRRHQKVLEEAPAPGLGEDQRHEMGQAAVAAAKAVGYVGAGTVEFIAEADERGEPGLFYFMEMNTRLQVEHPVTEMITGEDLVEWQLRVAAGEPLPCDQEDLEIHGHAIEARIYAENPNNQFLPSTGTLRVLCMPEESNDVRIDTGVAEGDEISPYYDPMIAKLIVWGSDRAEALSKMASALEQVQAVGLSTNVAFLKRLVQCEPFASGCVDTGMIARHQDELLALPTADAKVVAAAVAAQLELERMRNTRYLNEVNSPWAMADGWRVGSHAVRDFSFRIESQEIDIAARLAYRPATLTIDGKTYAWSYQPHEDGQGVVLELDGVKTRLDVHIDPLREEELHVFFNGEHIVLHYLDPLAHAGDAEHAAGKLTAPMPGKIISLAVKAGDVVSKGQTLLVMEAMKMEHTVTAPHEGTIEEIHYAVGEQVQEGAQLLSFVTT